MKRGLCGGNLLLFTFYFLLFTFYLLLSADSRCGDAAGSVLLGKSTTFPFSVFHKFRRFGAAGLKDINTDVNQ